MKAFLNNAARLENIVLFSKRAHDNSALATAAHLGSKMKNRKITRHFGNMSQSLSISTSTSSVTSTSNKQRSKRGSINKKKKIAKLHKMLKRKHSAPISSDYGRYFSNSD